MLRIECRGCPNAQSLENPTCFKGVLRVLAVENGVRRILLSRDWEIIYTADTVAVLIEMAEIVRFCNGLSYELPFEDCRDCTSNPRILVSRTVESLPLLIPEADGVPLQNGGHGVACEQCIKCTRSNLEHVRYLLLEIERQVTRAAYRIVPGDAHD